MVFWLLNFHKLGLQKEVGKQSKSINFWKVETGQKKAKSLST